MLNLPESGSCPKPNPMVSENVEGFQILHFHIRNVNNMDGGIFQDMEAAPNLNPMVSTNVEVGIVHILEANLPTGENVKAGIVQHLEATPSPVMITRNGLCQSFIALK